MTARLPATTDSSSVPRGMWAALVAWIIFIACCAFLTVSGVASLLAGDTFSTVFNLIFAIALGWSTAGFIINVPLSLYLTNRFANGQLNEIAQTYRKVLRIWEKLPVAKDVNFGVGLATLAFIQHTRGNFDDAEFYYRKALRVIEKNKRAAYPHLAAVANNYAGLLVRQHRFVEAEYLLNTSLSIWEGQKGNEWNGSAIPLCSLASMCLESGDIDQAENYLLNARRRFESADPQMILPDSMWQCKTVCFLGLTLVYCKKKQWADSFKFMEMAMDLVHRRTISFGPLSIYTANKIVSEFLAAEKFDQAERMLELAYAIGGMYPDHPDTINLLEQYDSLLRLTGRTAEIADMKRWIRPVEHKPKSITSSET